MAARSGRPGGGRSATQPLDVGSPLPDHRRPDGPIYEGWLTLAAWAQATERIRIGLMVGANTFRNPALVAKMATTLDHISNGRAILGIGAAWFEEEHVDLRDRVRRRLSGAAALAGRGAADHARDARRDRADGDGRALLPEHTRNDPPPIQAHLPICIGGGGEKVTLKLVAKYGDMNNIGGGIETGPPQGGDPRPATARRVGRDPAEIERTTGLGTVLIRDDRAEAERLVPTRHSSATARPARGTDQPVGTPEDVAEKLAPYLELGYHHLIAGFPSPYDEESMTRLATEVRPMLERSAAAAV